jgi:hypothetical protein
LSLKKKLVSQEETMGLNPGNSSVGTSVLQTTLV